MNAVIMAGALDTFDVPSILQAVSLSRQHTSIRLWGPSREETGEIRVKAGQLLHAATGALRGKAAFHSIVRGNQHRSFRVERLPMAVNLPEPIGPLARLLLEVPEQTEAAPPPRPATQTLPPKAVVRTLVSASPPPPPRQAMEPEPAVSSAELARVVQHITAIESVALEDLGRGPLAAWSRGPADPAWLSYARGLVDLQRETWPNGDAIPFALLQLPSRIVVIQALKPDVAAVYALVAKTPFGMVRWIVSELGPSLASLLRPDGVAFH